VTQSAISLRVCDTVSNLPQGLCYSQRSPSESVPQ